MGILFLVATPIGNLEDITYRAVRILREVALIAAEDTRTAKKLLTRYDIHTPLISFHEHSPNDRLRDLIHRLEDGDVALVSEAGMPGISDPGFPLVQAAVQAGYPIVPVPGPSAVTAALAVSGLPSNSFLFLGFLPSKKTQRRRALTELMDIPHTIILFEAPHRLLDSLADVHDCLGDRQLAACREMTKLHEEIWRGTVSQAITHFAAQGTRGEFTLVIAGAGPDKRLPRWSVQDVEAALDDARGQGMGLRQAAKSIAESSGWPAREVYRIGSRR